MEKIEPVEPAEQRIKMISPYHTKKTFIQDYCLKVMEHFG